MHAGNSLSKESERLFRAVQDAATGFEATVTQEPPVGEVVSLQAKTPGGAAPVQFCVESSQLISCFPGTHGLSFDLLSCDFDELIAGVIELTSAILRGEYREWVSTPGRTPRVVGTWLDAAGLIHDTSSNLPQGWLERNAVLHSYGAYRREDR